MKLIARQPCNFGGKRFYIGDEIPAEYVLNPQSQESLGVLAIVQDAPAPAIENPAPHMSIAIRRAEGDMLVEPTDEGMQAIFDALTSNVEDAKAIVEQMTDGDALILLHVTDGRKSVQAAAEARAKELNEGEQ